MAEWIDSTIIIAIIAVIGVVAGHFLNRNSRKDELTSQRTADLIKGQGDQIDRLTLNQSEDRKRIERIEKVLRETERSLWDEQTMSRRLRHGLGDAVDSLDEIWVWVDSDRSVPPPAKPTFVRFHDLLEHRPHPPDAKIRDPTEG